MRIELGGSPLRILDFDVECRPLSWYGGDWVTKEITAISWAWIVPGQKKKVTPGCVVLGEHPALFDGFDDPHLADLASCLQNFREMYDAADLVTGHFIRGFDLPLVNSQFVELGMPVLSDKLTHDTKLDLVRFSGLSKSQENLGAVLGLKHPKVQMDQAAWRAANRLTPEGIALTRKRVTGDVRQHIEMRDRMLELGLLGRPRVWSAKPSGTGKYAP